MTIVSAQNCTQAQFQLLVDILARQDSIIAFLVKHFSKDETERKDNDAIFTKIILENYKRISDDLFTEYGAIDESELKKE
jgi:hypothetical protein